MKQFLKPTLAKVIITLLLPTFFVILGLVYCLCTIDSPCDCPPHLTYAPMPMPVAIFFYIKFGRYFEEFNIFYSIFIGFLSAYLIAASIIYLVGKLKFKK